MITCKFRCHFKEEVKHTDTGKVSYSNIKLSPVVSGSEENKNFYKYTPAGEINLLIINPEAAAQIEQGKEYYIDIHE